MYVLYLVSGYVKGGASQLSPADRPALCETAVARARAGAAADDREGQKAPLTCTSVLTVEKVVKFVRAAFMESSL